MKQINVDIKATDCAIPSYESELAAGMDLRSNLDGKLIIKSNDTVIVPTGIYIAIPEGYEAQIRSRSGLATRGLIVANAPGTIDADYRGEIKIILHNQSNVARMVEYGDRIAQMVFAPVVQAKFTIVRDLPITVRNTSGFGSTGIK